MQSRVLREFRSYESITLELDFGSVSRETRVERQPFSIREFNAIQILLFYAHRLQFIQFMRFWERNICITKYVA